MPASPSSTTRTRRSALGGDVGGSKFRFLDVRRGQGEVFVGGNTSEYSGLIPMLLDVNEKTGNTPEAAVIAIAGNWKNGRWDFTNLPKWESVTEREVLDATGIYALQFINDMQAAQVGAATIDRSELVLLKPGLADQTGRSITAFTASTGHNFNSGPAVDAEYVLSMAGEEGHVRPPVPIDFSDVMYLVAHASKGRPDATVEDLLGGQRGPAMIADYVATAMQTPSDEVRKQLDNTPPDEVGKLMTRGVMDGDPFWTEVGGLYADLLGYDLNSVIVGDLSGDLVLQGSVIMGTEGFAEWMFDPANTNLLENLISAGARKAYVAEECTVYGAPDEANMATLGALRIAQSQLISIG